MLKQHISFENVILMQLQTKCDPGRMLIDQNKSILCYFANSSCSSQSKEKNIRIVDNSETICRSVFTAAMACDRFAFIRRFIRFDNTSTRVHRKTKNKLAAIREVWD